MKTTFLIIGCTNPIGLSDGHIITGTQTWASSEDYTGGVYSSKHAAPLGFTGPTELGTHWSPSVSDTNPYIQVRIKILNEVNYSSLNLYSRSVVEYEIV